MTNELLAATEQSAGVSGAVSGDHRRRLTMATTIHPQTVDRLKYLCDRFGTSQGRLIDKLVEVAHRAYTSKKMLCISGAVCTINRTDLPEVF
jgi:hypothetical protein